MRDERTYKIIGTAIEACPPSQAQARWRVHKELGCGFLEAVYQEALQREFKRWDVGSKTTFLSIFAQ